jgi:hypothetical protein
MVSWVTMNAIDGKYFDKKRHDCRNVRFWVATRTNGQDEDRLVTGKGGGDRKKTFRRGGDDQLFAAGALVFFIWASRGGLGLH